MHALELAALVDVLLPSLAALANKFLPPFTLPSLGGVSFVGSTLSLSNGSLLLGTDLAINTSDIPNATRAQQT